MYKTTHFSPLKRKIVIKTTICFFSSKPRLCFSPLVPALIQKQLGCGCLSEPSRIFNSRSQASDKSWQVSKTRGLLALFCEIHTCRVSAVHVHEPAPHRVPIWEPPSPYLSDFIWPELSSTAEKL